MKGNQGRRKLEKVLRGDVLCEENWRIAKSLDGDERNKKKKRDKR